MKDAFLSILALVSFAGGVSAAHLYLRPIDLTTSTIQLVNQNSFYLRGKIIATDSLTNTITLTSRDPFDSTSQRTFQLHVSASSTILDIGEARTPSTVLQRIQANALNKWVVLRGVKKDNGLYVTLIATTKGIDQ